MCGRTSCHLPRDVLARACAYRDRQGRERLPEWKDPDKYCPSYNTSPQSDSPVLLSRVHFEKGADSSERVIAPMRWGLVPSWFKEDDPSKLQFHTTNCRSDTIMEKRSFRLPLEKGRRCVILADGFYEWQKCLGTAPKQAYFIYFPQAITEESGSVDVTASLELWEKVWGSWRLLTMAGVFDCWEPPGGGGLLYSYTVITVDACKSLSDIHHRMPAILDGEEEVSRWLDFGEVSAQEALKLIRPTENIRFHAVSSVVNNACNSSPDCVTPVNLLARKELKASRSSQKMMQWLATKSPTKSPTKEDPQTPQKAEPDVPQWRSQVLHKSPLPPKRGAAALLARWLKREEPVAKRPHSQ
ncbi:abasic site processing protein HMCES [Hyaena hyaena]|uniref:abasic site processing protein HMCES n=1 Tax=Hyaena hyaena TaxID=95912 RepID=UPI00192121AA|nr:abasic site processing protein HMCES [Hyaena hyaena]XP_039104534.1 abasic site processing protein HMCES [Hyaena hyaena]XP_039104535.1 abasic site processing protein HMCES [Hyaena hyaena]